MSAVMFSANGLWMQFTVQFHCGKSSVLFSVFQKNLNNEN